jgi:hypothetical protein
LEWTSAKVFHRPTEPAGCAHRSLPAASLFGFAAESARREDRFVRDLLSGLPARPFRFLGSPGLLFGLHCRCTRRGRFRLGGRAFSRFTLLPRLFLGLPRSNPEITGRNDCLSRLPPRGRFGASRSGLGTLHLCLPRFLGGAEPVG